MTPEQYCQLVMFAQSNQIDLDIQQDNYGQYIIYTGVVWDEDIQDFRPLTDDDILDK